MQGAEAEGTGLGRVILSLACRINRPQPERDGPGSQIHWMQQQKQQDDELELGIQMVPNKPVFHLLSCFSEESEVNQP